MVGIFNLVRKIDDKVFKVFIAFLIVMWCFKMKHGISTIVKPVSYPSTVPSGVPFSITYTIRNTGQTADVLWAYLLADGMKLPNSAWSKKLSVNGSASKTYTHPGITKDTIFIIQTGY